MKPFEGYDSMNAEENMMLDFIKRRRQGSSRPPCEISVDGYRFQFADCRDLDEGIDKDLYGTRYKIGGREYVDIKTMKRKRVKEISDDILIYKDKYGNPVIGFFWEIPVFDSFDSEWSSYGALFLVSDGRQIAAVSCSGGYKLAELKVYEKLQAVSQEVIPLFQEAGFQTGVEII